MDFIREFFYVLIFIVVKRVLKFRVFIALKGSMSFSFWLSGHFVILKNVVASYCWFWFGYSWGSSSEIVVDQCLLLVVVDIEVSYWIYELFLELSSGVFSPGSFYLRHIQKVDNQNTVFEVTLENIFDYFLVSFVDENSFLFWD